MQTGQTNTASSGPKEQASPTSGSGRYVAQGPGYRLQAAADNGAYPAAALFELIGVSSGRPLACVAWDREHLDVLIGHLKEARAVAWPKPLKDLCPASGMLLKYLKKYGNVTPIKAREELGIEHLPRRIKDLKEHGYEIVTRYRKGVYGKRYAKYVMNGKKETAK